MSVDFDVRGQYDMDFFTGESNIMGREKSSYDGFVFIQTYSFLLHNMLIDGLEWIIVMFLSAVWTLILTAPIHCRGSIGELVM